jgi:hypothetical protein
MADTPGSGLSAGWVAVLTAITALVGALAGFGATVATGWFAFASKDEGIVKANERAGLENLDRSISGFSA